MRVGLTQSADHHATNAFSVDCRRRLDLDTVVSGHGSASMATIYSSLNPRLPQIVSVAGYVAASRGRGVRPKGSGSTEAFPMCRTNMNCTKPLRGKAVTPH